MTPLEQLGTALAVAVALVSLAKAGFAMARFFAGLSANLQALTDAVKTLTRRLDSHTSDFGDLRERVAALESWREDLA